MSELIETLKQAEPALTPRLVQPDELDAVDQHFDGYLKAYTSLSLRLFGRWPAFVKKQNRAPEYLTDAAKLTEGPALPQTVEDLEEEARKYADAAHKAEVREKALTTDLEMVTSRVHQLVEERDAALVATTALESTREVLGDTKVRLEEAEVRAAKLDERLRGAESRARTQTAALKEERAARLASERKVSAMRSKLIPLEQENTMLRDAVDRSTSSHGEMHEIHKAMREENAKNRSVAESAQRRVEEMQRALLTKKAHTSLWARELGAREAANEEAKEKAERVAREATAALGLREQALQRALTELEETRHALQLAERREHEAQQTAAQQARAAAEATRRASVEVHRAQERSDAAVGASRAELDEREEERRRLFVVLSELIGRLLYLDSASDLLVAGGGRDLRKLVEAQREGAIRHLRRIQRQLDPASEVAPLEVAPYTACVGASVLRSACEASGTDALEVSKIARKPEPPPTESLPELPLKPSGPRTVRMARGGGGAPRPGLARRMCDSSKQYEATDWEKAKLLSIMASPHEDSLSA